MSLWWLTYSKAGKVMGVVLVEAGDILQARFRANVEGIDQDADFTAGHGLDTVKAAQVPAGYVGRMLSIDEAKKLIRRFEKRARKV
jgi:hypothetical protein